MRRLSALSILLVQACVFDTGGYHGTGPGTPDAAPVVIPTCEEDQSCPTDAGVVKPPSGDGGTASGGADAGGSPMHECYTETIAPMADNSDLRTASTGANWKDTAFGIYMRRWPAGHDLLVAMSSDPYEDQFADTSSFAALMESLMTVCHEETHGWDYAHATADHFAYWLRTDLTFMPPTIEGFPRSEILPMVEGTATANYDTTYLTGEQGTYGFVEVLDELDAYIDGMAGLTVVGEYETNGISARDGAVALLYYLELYLKRARTTYPMLYAQLQAEPQYVQLVKTQWLRTHFFLTYADTNPMLGIDDAAIRTNLYEPANQHEIEMFIGHPVAASNCLP
jgi:hypothetical protein